MSDETTDSNKTRELLEEIVSDLEQFANDASIPSAFANSKAAAKEFTDRARAFLDSDPIAVTPHQVGISSVKDLGAGAVALAPLAPAIEWATSFTPHPMSLDQAASVLLIAYIVACASSYIMGRIRGRKS